MTDKLEDNEPANLAQMVSTLLEQSGEIAQVDFGPFGRRAGEIIARAAHSRPKQTDEM